MFYLHYNLYYAIKLRIHSSAVNLNDATEVITENTRVISNATEETSFISDAVIQKKGKYNHSGSTI